MSETLGGDSAPAHLCWRKVRRRRRPLSLFCFKKELFKNFFFSGGKFAEFGEIYGLLQVQANVSDTLDDHRARVAIIRKREWRKRKCILTRTHAARVCSFFRLLSARRGARPAALRTVWQCPRAQTNCNTPRAAWMRLRYGPEKHRVGRQRRRGGGGGNVVRVIPQ